MNEPVLAGSSSPGPSQRPPEPTRRLPLHTKILLGLILGAVAGIATKRFFAMDATAAIARDENHNAVDDRLDRVVTDLAEPVGRVFLRLVFMVVVPLVFSALALGVLGIGDVRRLGRVGARTLGFTLAFSLTAVAIGLGLVNSIRPGSGLSTDQQAALKTQYQRSAKDTVRKAREAKPLRDTLLDIIPENPLQEMVGALDGTSKGNGMLAVMFFSLVFGIALTVVAEDRRAGLVRCLEGLFDVCMVIIGFAMRLAPLAVGCLVFALTARLGTDILRTLAWFVATVLIGLGTHLAVIYSTAVATFGRRDPREFFRAVSEAMLTAFGTSSSNATLPTAMRVAETNLRLPREISNFVLTVGATGNQNGTALYEGVVVLFLAQVFGVDLSIWQQVQVVLMSVLAGVGTAGVPGGSLPLIVVVLNSVGVPGEGIAIILGVDRVLDMCRTVLNVTGDLAVATCVAEGERRRTAPASPSFVGPPTVR
jgi:DAACS family dicarboxylate/amino acid:cation (Na+ or H+) symporter